MDALTIILIKSLKPMSLHVAGRLYMEYVIKVYHFYSCKIKSLFGFHPATDKNQETELTVKHFDKVNFLLKKHFIGRETQKQLSLAQEELILYYMCDCHLTVE